MVDIVPREPPAVCGEDRIRTGEFQTGGTAMADNLRGACDGILQKVVTGKPRVPVVVALITSRSANIYEGAGGERVLGSQALTTHTVFAIFSTTKAITRTALLQC